ncbi:MULTISPECIES: hypothetical protein [unclassified Plantibacter]|jgi:hypothetical protein|uniref:hypothetical protein n=1 Tax=unclassified Plantibacter TaxID=2624265 RepID=UPI003D32968A
MERLEQLRIPARRKAAEIGRQLTETSPESFVRATFTSPGYGTYSIVGSARQVSSLYVAGVELGAAGKPSRDVVALEAQEALDFPTDVEAVRDRAELAEVVSALQAGDVVHAYFADPSYGPFSLIGVAVASPDGREWLVGSWFLSRKGGPAARLIDLEVVAAAGSHDVPVPAALQFWPSAKDEV